MSKKSIKNRIIDITAVIGIILVSAMPTIVNAHDLIYDESRYDQKQFSVDIRQCEDMLSKVGNHEVDGAAAQGVKRGLRGAAAGAAAGSISGNSGSSAAKTGAAVGTTVGILSGRGSKQSAENQNQKERNDLMRNCMSGRGYEALN